jgi:histidine triad (HIT) family protein
MTTEHDCIFCQIVRGEAPCHKIYEDDHVIAFLDIFPAALGHTLIVPKQHASDIFAASPEMLAAVGASSVTLANALDAELKPAGLGVYQLNRAAAGQTVFHYHMHLIPRFDGGELSIHAKEMADEAALAELATLLRKRLAA